MKFSLTSLFIKRPTLVFVIVALMMFGGILSTITIVKELYPDVSQPTVTIQVQYSGASVTEMRDNIVQPIEQNLAGTADLQTVNSVVQQGFASITAIFDINSDTATDLALSNKAIQASEKYLPTNITPPTVNLYDPTQSVVVTLAIYSQKLSLSRLALYAQNVIAPQLEQVPGISFVNVGGLVTPAYEVVVDPIRLAAANLTFNDIINTLQTDNQRVPGGFAYEPNRQTTIDVRGDIQNLDTVRNLAVIPAGSTSIGSAIANSTGAQVQNYVERPFGSRRRRQSVDGQQRRRPHRGCCNRNRRVRAALAIRADQRQVRPLHAGAEIRHWQRGRCLEQRAARVTAGRAAISRDQFSRHQRAVEVHGAADRNRDADAHAGDSLDRHRDDLFSALLAQCDRRLHLDPDLACDRDNGHED